jgi:hypothetical protein
MRNARAVSICCCGEATSCAFGHAPATQVNTSTPICRLS